MKKIIECSGIMYVDGKPEYFRYDEKILIDKVMRLEKDGHKVQYKVRHKDEVTVRATGAEYYMYKNKKIYLGGE